MTNLPSFQANKWLQFPLLINAEEMKQFLHALQPFQIFFIGRIVPKDQTEISLSSFLQVYQEYISSLEKGIIPLEENYRPFFSSLFTSNLEAISIYTLSESEEMVKIVKPVIQLQVHNLQYSPLSKKLYSTFGKDAISWGIQFSFPQIYLNLDTQEIIKTFDDENDPNLQLFRRLQQWVRNHTIPTPFLIDEEKNVLPIRLGKECLPWINRHPQLQGLPIKIKT